MILSSFIAILYSKHCTASYLNYCNCKKLNEGRFAFYRYPTFNMIFLETVGQVIAMYFMNRIKREELSSRCCVQRHFFREAGQIGHKRLATAKMCLRSCATQALSPRVGPCSCYSLRRHTASRLKIVFEWLHDFDFYLTTWLLTINILCLLF